MRALLLTLVVYLSAAAQDTTAVLEGQITDSSGGVIEGATVALVSTNTGLSRSQRTTGSGAYHILAPVGAYQLRVRANGFAEYVRRSVELNVSQSARIDVQLQIAKGNDVVNVDAVASPVDAGSNTIGNVVTGRQLVDLPLNGRIFTQLLLVQPDVAPMTAGLAEAGGTLRGGQAYAVNGQRPESNNYLLDGVPRTSIAWTADIHCGRR